MLEFSCGYCHHHMIGYLLCDSARIFGAVRFGKHLVWRHRGEIDIVFEFAGVSLVDQLSEQFLHVSFSLHFFLLVGDFRELDVTIVNMFDQIHWWPAALEPPARWNLSDRLLIDFGLKLAGTVFREQIFIATQVSENCSGFVGIKSLLYRWTAIETMQGVAVWIAIWEFRLYFYLRRYLHLWPFSITILRTALLPNGRRS